MTDMISIMETEVRNFEIVRRQFSKFGTEVDLQIVLDSQQEIKKAEDDLLEAEKELERLGKIFSRFDEDSEISQLNLRLGEFVEASAELIEVAKLCVGYGEKTAGYFDPRIIANLEAAGYRDDFSKVGRYANGNMPQVHAKKLSEDIFFQDGKIKTNLRLDLAGVAKSWFVDRLAKLLGEKRYEDFVVDIGGDMFFSGHGPTGKAWYIDIESIDYQKVLLNLSGQAVATSGIGKRKWEIDGKRFHHLINPLAPTEFSFELKSVTVVSQKTADSDVWAKTIFLMGKEKGLQFARQNHIACAILDYRGNVFISDDIKKYIY